MRIAIRTGLACCVAVLGLAVVRGEEKEVPITGSFKGNGKEAKLMYATAMKGDEFSGKPTLVLIFTEKDHSKEKRAQSKAAFGDFGSALIVTVLHDGKIIGCEIAHSAHKKSGFSSVGSMQMTDFKMADGKVKGTLATEGEVETFKEKWEVKLKFDVPNK